MTVREIIFEDFKLSASLTHEELKVEDVTSFLDEIIKHLEPLKTKTPDVSLYVVIFRKWKALLKEFFNVAFTHDGWIDYQPIFLK